VDTAKPQAVEKPPVEKPAPPATPPTAKTPPPKVLAKAPMEVEESPDAPERPEAEPRDPLASTAGKMGPLVPSEAEFQPVRVGPVKKEPEPPAKVQPDIKAQPDIKVEPPAKVEAKIEPPGKPEPKAEAPVKPESPAVEPPGPHGAPAIGATDLKKALQDAKDVCEAKPWDQLGDDGCEKLRQLAEIATPLKGHPGDQDLQPALELLGRAAASPPALKRVTESAQKMLQDAAKAQGGILLAGTVTKLAEKGGLVGIVFTTDASPAPVMVLADRNPGVKEGERALLAGRIVNDPAKNLPGYTGRKPYVIWVGMACKLP